MTPDTEKHRETRAMPALLLFHPFRHLEDLQTDGSYWTTFDTCRTTHFSLVGRGSSPAGSVSDPDESDAPSFWSKGFDMLQNMEETSCVGKNISRTVDSLTWETTCRHEEEDNTTDEKNDKDDLLDISFFCEEEESDGDAIDDVQDERTWHYSHTSLISQSNGTRDRAVEARLTSHNSLVIGDDADAITAPALITAPAAEQ